MKDFFAKPTNDWNVCISAYILDAPHTATKQDEPDAINASDAGEEFDQAQLRDLGGERNRAVLRFEQSKSRF